MSKYKVREAERHLSGEKRWGGDSRFSSDRARCQGTHRQVCSLFNCLLATLLPPSPSFSKSLPLFLPVVHPYFHTHTGLYVPTLRMLCLFLFLPKVAL